MDSSPPGSPIPGILQARTLEWVTISFSNAWKWKVKVKSFSHVRLFTTPWIAAYQAPPSMGFSRQAYWSGVPLPSPFKSLSFYIFPPWILTKLLSLNKSKFVWTTHVFSILYTCAGLCLIAQSCPTLCNPIDCSPPGSSVYGIFQARILEWVAISFSGGSSCPRDQTPHLLSLLHWQAGSLPLAGSRRLKREGIYVYI